MKYAAPWNFGPVDGDAKPVAWIADELARSWGGDATWVNDEAVHPPEARALKLDASKAQVSMDWHPVLPLARALPWIVEWYRAFQSGADLGRLTREQIGRYEALVA